jgi:4-hydroxy-2-oxovalerate aldolase
LQKRAVDSLKPKILETTLRDGSYVLNFQFTANDTAVMCEELERAGFPLIEVGHGIGLGASRAGMGQAAESDEAYLRAAAGAIKSARWGMFCIPGIAQLEDVDMAAEHGMKFIRVGTNVTDVEKSEPFIVRAKRHGMMVCANFMKSYAMAPVEFAARAVRTQQFGSDMVYIVDSAGGMLTSEMEEYIKAVQDACNLEIGFHGHNNLDLAVANSLRAIELGVAVVDTSLQGLGRSAGNTPTEVLIAVLKRYGLDLGIDPLAVMDISEKYVRPLVQRHGYDSIDVVTGLAQFHSSYMGLIREFSSTYRVDPRRLIMEVCEQDRVNAPRDLVERAAQKLQKEGDGVFTARFRFDRYHGAEQREGNQLSASPRGPAGQ